MPRTPRLTTSQLTKEPEKQLRENTREVLKKYWDGVGKALDRGERWAFELMSRTYSYDKGPGGVTIYNQHLSVGGTPVHDSPRVKSFDQIIGKLEDQENAQRGRLLLEPAEDAGGDDDDEEDIEEAEVEEIGEPDVPGTSPDSELAAA